MKQNRVQKRQEKLKQLSEIRQIEIDKCADDMAFLERLMKVAKMKNRNDKIECLKDSDNFFIEDMRQIKEMRTEKASFKKEKQILRNEKKVLKQNIKITSHNLKEMKEINDIAERAIKLKHQMKDFRTVRFNSLS
ncbi:unnamed protein product [Moneuplotes crassus]|uniref:Uncharacterized protein n=1 Tax=Euplotes crassus TaxID=5936 RepID=A0AAD1XF20_EUPCR|nr:unnamed protein product [Moneuplotes crassus]